MIVWPQGSQKVLSDLKLFIENVFGNIYQLLTVSVLVFVLWLAFSRYGAIKLGDEKFRFNTFSWVSMLFCAGVATGILYWGALEWAYYYKSPPFGIVPKSNLAIEYASTYGLFHWGIAGWSFYCLPAIALGYVY